MAELRKITINLRTEDVEEIRRAFPHWGGWSAVVRRAVGNYAELLRYARQAPPAHEEETRRE